VRRPPSDSEYVLSTHVVRYLLDDERLVIAVRRHPARILEPFVTAFVTLVVAAWLDPRIPAGVPVALDILWLSWLAILGRAMWKFLEWRKDWFVATDRRLLLIYGIFSRRVAMMPLSKVTDLSYNRSPMGRLLGYGEFVMESAGRDQALRSVQWIPRPDAEYRRICAEMFDPEKSHWRPRDRPQASRDPRASSDEELPVEQMDADTGEIELWPRSVDERR
jgi:membrane protein YdbS with pleckstrin-like domain